jgi:RNA polymerase sigma-70 factor (ECF subfamily)
MDDAQLDDAASRSQAPSWSSEAGGFEAMDEQLVRAVQELGADYQTALLLWAIEDFSYKEIAAALDVPIGTVMSRLYRARLKLSERLRNFAREERIIRE